MFCDGRGRLCPGHWEDSARGGVVLDTARFNALTPDNDRLPLPKRSLLRIHYLLSLPLHFLAIERQINNGWSPIKQSKNSHHSHSIPIDTCIVLTSL